MQQSQIRLNRIPYNIFMALKKKVAFFFLISALIIHCRFLASLRANKGGGVNFTPHLNSFLQMEVLTVALKEYSVSRQWWPDQVLLSAASDLGLHC